MSYINYNVVDDSENAKSDQHSVFSSPYLCTIVKICAEKKETGNLGLCFDFLLCYGTINIPNRATFASAYLFPEMIIAFF